jgi:hypothetical protein
VKKQFLGGGGGFDIIIMAKHGAMAVLSLMQRNVGTDCHQYKSTLNMHEKAEPIGNSRCPHVLDVEHGTQSHHHGGVTMLCLSSTFMYQ